jgi:hypothetical protein
MEQRYTFTHPTDQQQYHADVKNAELLEGFKLKVRTPMKRCSRICVMLAQCSQASGPRLPRR